MSFLGNIADKYLDELFEVSRIDRIKFQSQAQNMKKDFFDDIQHIMMLTPEEREIKTNIAAIVQTPITRSIFIAPFPVGNKVFYSFLWENINNYCAV